MRFRNLSNIKIPRHLWFSLALSMGLGARLPQTIEDEYGMYGRNRTLRITVNPERERNQSHEDVIVGSYTFGHISLFPCPRCSVGFLTFTLLHELHHAWLHQYQEATYENTRLCEVAESFANDAFVAIGGRIIEPRKCMDFVVDVDLADSRIEEFQIVVARYCDMGSSQQTRKVD